MSITELDKKITSIINELIVEADKLIPDMQSEDERQRNSYRNSSIFVAGPYETLPERFYEFKTKCLFFLEFINHENSQIEIIIKSVHKMQEYSHHVIHIKGYLLGIRDIYDKGLLKSITSYIEAELISDYLDQAKSLLNEGHTGIYDHIPAAVLTGAVLENALRTLCNRQNPPIDIMQVDPKTGKSSHKMLGRLIDDLKKGGVFNELKAKQLRGWADIRNAAAHGNFNDFKRPDVEQMVQGVETFLADNL